MIRRGDLRPAFFVPLRRSKPAILVSDVFWAEEGLDLKSLIREISRSFGFMPRRVVGLIWMELREVYFWPLQLAVGGLFSSFLSMQKTKKSVAKRFKLTSTGKLVRRTPGFRHLLASKSTKQKRRASRDKLVAEGHAKPLKRCLPFGL